MNNIKINRFAWIIISIAIGTWLVLIFISEGSLSFTQNAFVQIPKVVTINVVLWLIFIKWCWKWRIFKSWLIPFPDISGKWKGEAIPKNINPETGKPYDRVELEVTIRQTFLFLHICVHSEEMESNSYAASFKLDEDTGEKRLCYSYLSKPKANIRDRSPIHDGTALLTIKNTGAKLEGEYWTNRQSTGELYLKRKKK